MLLATLALLASLEVRVTGGPRPLDVVLRHAGADDAVNIAVRRLPSGASSVSFRDLGAGSYVVIAAGADPLAQRATRVRLENGEHRRVDVRIEPRRVEGTVVRGGKPLPNVLLRFHNDDLGWGGTLQADAEGRFASELWQPGSYSIGIAQGALHNTYATHATVAGGPLALVVPVRQIRGRVIDVASGRGVPDVQVALRTQKEGSATTVSQRTDANGRFLFDAVPAGRQRVAVAADDYLIPDPVELTVAEDDVQEIALRLDSGFSRQLRVFDHHGQPVRGADVVVANGNRIRSASHTAADGRAVVATPAEPVTLYVIAPDGAFAVVDRRETQRVDLPAVRSSLRIVTRAPLGRTLPPVSFIMAVDGRVIPPAVARRARRSLSTDAAGELTLANIPAGEYQFWPYDGEMEMESIMAAPYEAPIAVSVKTGENVVAVDFRPASLPNHQ